MNKKSIRQIKTIFVILLLFIVGTFLNIPSIKVQAKKKEDNLTYNWQQTTFSYQIGKIWNADNFFMNETGAFHDIFNYTIGYENNSYWIVEDSIFTYNVNYSYVSNLTLTGNYFMRGDFEIYRVDISSDDIVNLIWLALKDGSLEAEYNINKMEYDYRHEYQYYKRSDITYKKYNITTMELVDTWNDTIEDVGTWTSQPSAPPNFTLHQTMNMDFSMPLIITYQVYTVQNNEKIAWAQMFSDFYVFKDMDKNGVYSLGETSSAPYQFAFSTSDEFCGMFMPWVYNTTIHTEYISSEVTINDTTNMKFPEDKDTSELAETIQFRPPTLVNNNIEWDISYPDYPIYGFIQYEDVDYFSTEGNYTDTSPGTFTYGFNFGLTNESTNFDLTTILPKLSDSDFYDAAQGLGLAFPHYTYFISSASIEESTNPVLTIPSNRFQFDVNGTKVAEISMKNPDKKNYTLVDYPEVGQNSTIDVVGSTVSKLISNEFENNPTTPKNWFLDSIFAIGDFDLVKLDPTFSNAFTLYNVEILNYPTWSGEKLIHDPSFAAFFKGPEDQPIQLDPEPSFIPGFTIFLPIGVSTILVIVYRVKKKKKI